MNPQIDQHPPRLGIPRNRILMRQAALDWREAQHFLTAPLYQERPTALPAGSPVLRQWRGVRVARGMRAAKLLRLAIALRDGGAR